MINSEQGYAFEAFTEGDHDVFDHLRLSPTVDPVTVNSSLPHLVGATYDAAARTFTTFNSNEAGERTLIIASPSLFPLKPENSPDCQEQAKNMETLYHQLKEEGIKVVEFTRQPMETVKEFVSNNGFEHTIVTVRPNMAEAMGARIIPIEAAVDYWGNGSEVTARTLTVATPIDKTTNRRTVVHRERKADQGSPLNLVAARVKARQALARAR